MEIYFHLQGKKQGTAALAAPCRLLLAIFLLYPCYILQLLSLPRMAGGRQGFRFPVSISGSIFRFPSSQPQAGHVTGMSSRSESFPSLPSPAPASRNAFGMAPRGRGFPQLFRPLSRSDPRAPARAGRSPSGGPGRRPCQSRAPPRCPRRGSSRWWQYCT